MLDSGARSELSHESQPKRERHEVAVRGVVQGVGFRPFVYRLALEEGLAGFIGNDTDGVTIEIEGPRASLDSFLARLRSDAPPLSRIDSVTVREAKPTGDTGFRIVASEVLGRVSTGIPADAATCPDCIRELLSPTDRRYRYPFLNCTNCGPRYTITRRIPYDRPQTSMARFKMCPACQAEYDDPANRRFHAQPNACWDCGPQLSLLSANGRPLSGEIAKEPSNLHSEHSRSSIPTKGTSILGGGKDHSESEKGHSESARTHPEQQEVSGHDFSRAANAPELEGALAPEGHFFSDSLGPVEQTISLLLNGEILAIKGIGGFHLSVDATNESAVMRLRQRKHRYGKPLAVMVRDLDAAHAICDLTEPEERLLTTPARPIVLVRKLDPSPIAPSVAPGIPWLGIFLPYAPLHHLLFADSRLQALVMTSANLSEEPIDIDNDEARARLGAIADAFLMHDREILQRCDDSVTAIVDSAPQIIRRARGFVPLGVQLPFEAPPLLAVGGHLKNVFALARGRFVYQSQHLGDLENLTGLNFFRESLDHLMRTFEIEPETVVHDLHPGYLSTEWAREWASERGLRLITVQHHHAHVACCMAEHAIESETIGISLDGTGYGTDGRIWGGEVLISRLDHFERFAHLDYVPMPGGEAAIRQPWRMAFGHLHQAGFDVESPEILNLIGAKQAEARVLHRMIERGVNTPLTSSCGRLFDAVAAVVLQRTEVDYEAQAAIELEGLAVDEPYEIGGTPANREAPAYELELTGGNWSAHDPMKISATPLWRGLIEDLRAGVARPCIAAKFHATIASAFIRAAIEARTATGIGQVALSGGCMHNRRLARLLRTGLEAEGFRVFQHRSVSPGDGGLSYGQAAVAASTLAKRS
jgi:hydrogenase maturation protein HypF